MIANLTVHVAAISYVDGAQSGTIGAQSGMAVNYAKNTFKHIQSPGTATGAGADHVPMRKRREGKLAGRRPEEGGDRETTTIRKQKRKGQFADLSCVVAKIRKHKRNVRKVVWK